MVAVADGDRAIDRFLTTLDLWATGVAIQRETIRRRFPDVSEDELDRLLVRWLQTRPGAELGDGPAPRTP